jgi:hypothetical protein
MLVAKFVIIVSRSTRKMPVIFTTILQNLNFREISVPPAIKIHKNPFKGSQVVPCESTNGQTDRGIHILKQILMFVCPCIVSIIRNWWPKRCNVSVYLFVPNQLYKFRAMFSSIIGSTWLYLQHLILFTDIVAGRYHGRDGTPFHLVHDTSQQQYRWTISNAVNTVKCSWWWKKTSPETCRADWVQINKPKICILLVINYEVSMTIRQWVAQ